MALSFTSSFIAALLALNLHLPKDKLVHTGSIANIASKDKVVLLNHLNQICKGLVTEVLGSGAENIDSIITPLLQQLKTEKESKVGKAFLGIYEMKDILESFQLVCASDFQAQSSGVSDKDLFEGIEHFKKLVSDLPNSKALTGLNLKQSIEVQSFDNKPIGYFKATEIKNEKKRRVHRLKVSSDEIPRHLKYAFLAAEDKDFYTNSGVSLKGIFNAFVNSNSGNQLYGGSTITQQLLKNTLLNYDKSIDRKINEVLLAYSVTKRYNKEEILSYYLNHINFGRGANGIKAASRVYLGKELNELNLNDMAFLASLPKNPNNYDPEKNYDIVFKRKNRILQAMLANQFAPKAEVEAQIDKAIEYLPRRKVSLQKNNQYFSDAVGSLTKAQLGSRFDENSSYQVQSSINPQLQKSLSRSLLQGIVNYEIQREKKYKKSSSRSFVVRNISAPIKKLQSKLRNDKNEIEKIREAEKKADEIEDAFDDAFDDSFEDSDSENNPSNQTVETESNDSLAAIDEQIKMAWLSQIKKTYNPIPDTGWRLAVKLSANTYGLKTGERVELTKEKGSFVSFNQFKYGDVLLVEEKKISEEESKYYLRRAPEAQATGVIMDVNTGAILALSGGVSYSQSTWNRATLSKRQPGSVIKPFSYLVALNQGFQPNFLLKDAPSRFPKLRNGGTPWSPRGSKNISYSWRSLRTGLETSNNRMTAKLLNIIGSSPLDSLNQVREITRDFGVYENPSDVSLSFILGDQEASIINVAKAYSSIANGGKKVRPHMINKIYQNKSLIHENSDSSEVEYVNVDSVALFQLRQILHGVTKRGTAKVLKDHSSYIAGKTGTTNFSQDAWFAGITPQLAMVIWVGYDNKSNQEKRYLRGDGGSIAAPIVKSILESDEYKNFENPQIEFPLPNESMERSYFNHKESYIATQDDDEAINEYYKAGSEWYLNYRDLQLSSMHPDVADIARENSYLEDEAGIDEYFSKYGSYEQKLVLARKREREPEILAYTNYEIPKNPVIRRNTSETEYTEDAFELEKNVSNEVPSNNKYVNTNSPVETNDRYENEEKIVRKKVTHKSYNKSQTLVVGSREYFMYMDYLEDGGNPDLFYDYLDNLNSSVKNRKSKTNYNKTTANKTVKPKRLGAKLKSPVIVMPQETKTIEEEVDFSDIFN